jgi:hypothetical protein
MAEILVGLVVAGLLIWALGARVRWNRHRTARYPQSITYGSFGSVFGGMKRPFSSTGYFLLWVVVVVLLVVVFA